MGKQLEELEWHFDLEDESPAEEDIIMKQQDEKDTVEQFADAETEPKAKKHKFRKCCNDLKDLAPTNQTTPIMPSTTVKLSEMGIPRKLYSDRAESEGQSIYRCLHTKPNMTSCACTMQHRRPLCALIFDASTCRSA